MQSVCFVVLPSPFLIDDKVFPPLGVLYVASALKMQGYEELHVHDGEIEKIPRGFDIYAVSATTPHFLNAKKALNVIRGYANGKTPRVIIGGPHATVDPESCLNAGFDGVVLNDGEVGMSLAAEYRCRIIDAPSDIDIHPDRSLIDLRGYKYLVDGEPATSVMTTKGCPYKCAFCCKVRKNVRIFPASHVIDELRFLKDHYGYKAFMFFDDIFILNKPRLLTILDEIKHWNIKWRCFARADIIVRHGQEIMNRMAEAGCKEIGMGVESGSNKILKIINKGEDVDTLKRAVEIVKKANIRIKGFFIVGLPSESPETIGETVNFIKEVELDELDFTILQPYKKSDIYDNKHLYDINWDHLDLQKSWYKGTPGEYESQVWTSKLSARDIVYFRDELEKKFKKWGA